MFGAVFEGLAERESKVNPVHEADVRARCLHLHGGKLCFGKTIGLEIGQRVIRITMAGPRSDRGAIGRHSAFLIPDRLQRMAARRQRRRIAGQARQYTIEKFECPVVIAGLHAFDRQVGLKQRAVRISLIQRLCFFA